jgi:hypothetical protein
MDRREFLIWSGLFLLGCNGEDEEEEKRDPPPSDKIEDDDIICASKPSGFAEAGPYQGYSEVTMWPLDSSYKQIGDPYVGDTKADDSGQFTIYADVVAPNVKTKVKGSAFNETNAGFDDNVITESTIPTSAGSFNANYFSSIVSIVGNYWFHEDTKSVDYQKNTAFDKAEIAVHDYFDYSGLWPAAVKKSYEMTLTGDSLDDAKLVLVNSTIALGKSGPEQGAFMREIAEDIYNGTNVLKASVSDITANLMLKTIKDNLDNYYSDRSLPFDCAPVWELPGIPDYYADLLNRVPVVLDSVNTEFISAGNMDTPGFNIFAYPVEFTSDQQKYIALNLAGTLSIWTVGLHVGGYPVPASKVADLSVLSEVLLDDPVGLQYNYLIDGSVSFGQYFIVQEFLVNTQPSKLITGDMASFGRNMASSDMVDWIGWNNTTNWYRRSIKFVSYD